MRIRVFCFSFFVQLVMILQRKVEGEGIIRWWMVGTVNVDYDLRFADIDAQ